MEGKREESKTNKLKSNPYTPSIHAYIYGSDVQIFTSNAYLLKIDKV